MKSSAHRTSIAASVAMRAPTKSAPQLFAPSSTRRGGQSLEHGVRADMERRFARPFGDVRIHRNAGVAERFRANAVTAGNDIAFAPGRYAPTTPSGRGILAHELAHVVQQRIGRARPDAISAPDDRDEVAAGRAVGDLAAGRRPALGAAASGWHRQPAGDAPTLEAARPSPAPATSGVSPPSTQELVLESFLNRMWFAQSEQQQPFRLTAKVLEGLAAVFPFGAPLGVVTHFDSTAQVMDLLRRRLGGPIDPNVAKVLDRLPSQEPRLKPVTRHDQAEPDTPQPGAPGGTGPQGAPGPTGSLPDIGGKPQPKDNYDDAAVNALQAAFAVFSATRLGRELKKSATDYVFSKKGIPLVIFVTAAGIVFLAVDDPKLPSLPEIPIAEGISLKIDLSAKASEVPGLLGDLVHDRASGPAAGGTPERKVGVTATFTFEAVGEAASAIGHFFSEAAVWIGKGIVKAGTVIGQGIGTAAKAVGGAFSKIPSEVLFGAGGAALGAGIGALAGGGIGALIGAGVGLAVGVGAGVVKRLVGRARP